MTKQKSDASEICRNLGWKVKQKCGTVRTAHRHSGSKSSSCSPFMEGSISVPKAVSTHAVLFGRALISIELFLKWFHSFWYLSKFLGQRMYWTKKLCIVSCGDMGCPMLLMLCTVAGWKVFPKAFPAVLAAVQNPGEKALQVRCRAEFWGFLGLQIRNISQMHVFP